MTWSIVKEGPSLSGSPVAAVVVTRIGYVVTAVGNPGHWGSATLIGSLDVRA